MNPKEYLQLRDKIDRLRRTASQKEGVLTRLKEQLKTEFGAETVEQARKLLEEKLTAQKASEAELEEVSQKFQTKWRKYL